MSRKRCHRAYHPDIRRGPVMTPIEQAIWGASRITEAERKNLNDEAAAVFNVLRTGHGNISAWKRMADVCNLAEAVITEGIGLNLVPSVQAANNALRALMKRAQAGGSWTMYADEIKAIDELLDVYDAQLQICSHREFQRAELNVRRQVAGALAGNTGRKHEVHIDPQDIKATAQP